VALFFVAHLFAEIFFEGWEEIEGDVGGLEFFCLGVGDVVGQAAVGRASWCGCWRLSLRNGCGVDAGQHAAGNGFGVAFDSAKLAGDHDAGMGFELEGFSEERWGVDVGVAMDLAVAEEGCVFEAGDELEDAVLFAVLEVVLEAYEIVGVGAEVLLTELDDGVGPAAGLGIGEAYGFHGAEAESVASAAGGLFDGEAALEVLKLLGCAGCREFFPVFGFYCLGGGEGFHEAFVLFFGEGAVDVVGCALVVAGGEVDLVHVDGSGVDDGGDGVVEGKVVRAGEALEFGG